MANLTYQQVLLVGLAATVGTTMLAYGWSAYMARRNRSYQLRPKAPKEPKQDRARSR